jgi:hypothetical protein
LQIVILQEKIIFVIFYDLFLKIMARSDWPTSDGRWGLMSLEMRSRASILNGHLTLKTAIYGRRNSLQRSSRAGWLRELGSWIYLTTHTSLLLLRHPQVIKFTSCLPMVGGSLRVLRLLPPLKQVAMIYLKYCWK